MNLKEYIQEKMVQTGWGQVVEELLCVTALITAGVYTVDEADKAREHWKKKVNGVCSRCTINESCSLWVVDGVR